MDIRQKLFCWGLTGLVCMMAYGNSNHITVIGIGRLGLCTALCFERAGYQVLGVDINQDYVDKLNTKRFVSLEPKVNEFLRESNNFRATTSFDEGLAFADIYFIIVDTPTTHDAEAYDHTKLNLVLRCINERRVSNKHIVISCTVFPGYIDNVAKKLLSKCANTTLSYNPSFIAQGNIMHGLCRPDMVLIGEGSCAAGDIIESIHRNIWETKIPQVCRMSPVSAEITKLALNCFITTKIAYANMIADIADRTPDADKEAILNAVGKDRRVGAACLKSGYGFGGPCFPRDNRALGCYAQSVGIDPLIPQATDLTNKQHAQEMARRLLEEDTEAHVFNGVAYKENCPVPIIEESQKLLVAALVAQRGKKVTIADSQAVIEQVQKSFGDLFEYDVV